MFRYITITSMFLAALLALTPLVYAQDAATPATLPVLPDTPTNAILDELFTNRATPAQIETFDDGLVHLIMPASLDFIIDPFELIGLGSVYSRDYGIQNLGGNGVEVIITGAELIFPNNEDFEAVAEPFDYSYKTDKKAIYLELRFSREDIPPIVVSDPDSPKSAVITMPAGSEPVTISIGGNANCNPAKEWFQGEVKINVSYQVNPLPAEETSESVPATEVDDDSWEPLPPEATPANLATAAALGTVPDDINQQGEINLA